MGMGAEMSGASMNPFLGAGMGAFSLPLRRLLNFFLREDRFLSLESVRGMLAYCDAVSDSPSESPSQVDRSGSPVTACSEAVEWAARDLKQSLHTSGFHWLGTKRWQPFMIADCDI